MRLPDRIETIACLLPGETRINLLVIMLAGWVYSCSGGEAEDIK